MTGSSLWDKHKFLVTDVTQNALFTFVGTWACPVPTLNWHRNRSRCNARMGHGKPMSLRSFGFDWFA